MRSLVRCARICCVDDVTDTCVVEAGREGKRGERGRSRMEVVREFVADGGKELAELHV